MNKYVRLPIEKLVSDVAVDLLHIKELADSIKSRGQLAPVIVREETLEVIDGFHRIVAMKELGFKEVECVLTPCDDESFWDFRIIQATTHKNVTFARAIDWIEKVFQLSPLYKHWEYGGGRRYKSAYSVFASYRQGNPPEEVKKWVENKAAMWGLAPKNIEDWLYTKQSLAAELLEEVTSPSEGERGIAVYKIVAEILPSKPELQKRIMAKAKVENLPTKDLRMLALALKQAQNEEEVQGILNQPVNRIGESVSPHAAIAEELTMKVKKGIEEAINKAPEKVERIADIVEEEMRGLQKRLEIFPEKSQKIQPKFEKFETLLERGVIPYTVWDFPERDDYAGDKDFHGNCSPQIVEQCIWRLTEEADLVVDPMAGSGTALDVCRAFNRRCIGYDLKPPLERKDIIQNDSRNIPLADKSVDMIFIHPPYLNLVYFTKAEEKLPDLSRATTAEQFLEMLKEVFEECHRILKPGKFMCVLLGDLIREGSFIPLCRRTANLIEEIGFIDYGCAVKLAHGEVSRKKSGVIVAEPLYTDNLKVSHDLIMFFRKPLWG